MHFRFYVIEKWNYPNSLIMIRSFSISNIFVSFQYSKF